MSGWISVSPAGRMPSFGAAAVVGDEGAAAGTDCEQPIETRATMARMGVVWRMVSASEVMSN